MKSRKNLKSFTPAEKKKLKKQLVKIFKNGGLATFGEIHTIWAVHGIWDTTFFPWHRLHLAQLEHSLGMGLPFWDWTEDRLPDFFSEVFDYRHSPSPENCPSPKEWSERKQITRLEPMNGEEEDKVIAGRRREVQKALCARSLSEFTKKIILIHNNVHVNIGCDMADPNRAAYDPIFFLHHTYVDHLFAFWQKLQERRMKKGEKEIKSPELKEKLQPFGYHKGKYENGNLRARYNNRGRDSFSYKKLLCYKYQKLEFNGMSPAQFAKQETKLCDLKKATRRQGGRRTGTVPFSVSKFTSVGVVLPYDAPSGRHTFQLCHERGSCVEAGEVFTFSRSTHSTHRSDSSVGKSTHYVAEKDVTEVVEENFPKASGEQLRAELIETGIEGLPQPLVIQRANLGENVGEVILHPDQKSEDYGDLLEEYEGEEDEDDVE